MIDRGPADPADPRQRDWRFDIVISLAVVVIVVVVGLWWILSGGDAEHVAKNPSAQTAPSTGQSGTRARD
jgi:hypothetical protein